MVVRLDQGFQIDHLNVTLKKQNKWTHTVVARWMAPVLGPVLGLVCLLAWQLSIFRTNLRDDYTLKASSGLHAQKKFVYFLYYLNLFPIASLEAGRDAEFFFDGRTSPPEPDTLVYSQNGARQVLQTAGDTLVMEWGHSTRFGGNLQTYLYLPDAWRLGSPKDAEMRIATSLAFAVGLAGVFVSAWVIGLRALAIVLVVFLGSNPFELYEAYRRENVFGWPIAVFCLTLALMLPILAGVRRGWYFWSAAVAAGVLLGTAYQIRLEGAALIAGVVVAFLCVPGASARSRTALAGLACVSFVVTIAAWYRYFDHKWAEATAIVTEAGGHPYVYPRAQRHQLWGDLWAGLGDFDTKYGHSWQDAVAVAYTQKMVRDRYGEELPWWWTDSRGRTHADYFDAAELYYRHPSQNPHVGEVMRDKFLEHVRRDPMWYLSIARQRVWRVLNQTTPVQVFITDNVRLPLPFRGYLVIPIVLMAVVLRDWFAVRLIAFSLPLSLLSLAVYSGGNTPYYSVYHLCAAAVAVTWILTYGVMMLSRNRSAHRTGI